MSDPETSDIEALRATREESRAVLDHQIALQSDVDEKALLTVRLALVLIALVVSITQLMEAEQVASLDTGTLLSVGVGVLGLSVAIFVGLGVYVETDIPFVVGYLFVSALALTTPLSPEETFLGGSFVGGIAIVLYFVRTRERA